MPHVCVKNWGTNRDGCLIPYYPVKATRDGFYKKPLPVCLAWLSAANANALKGCLVQFGGSASVVETCAECVGAASDSAGEGGAKALNAAPLAMNLMAPEEEAPARRAPARKAKRKPTSGKAPSKKAASKKAASKKATGKKTASKKPTARKTASKKAASKKPMARKTASKKAAGRGGTSRGGGSRRGGSR